MADPAALHAAMNRLWEFYLPQIRERVEALRSAAASLAEGSLTGEQCKNATAAAHNLAGVLGTFGLAEGTTLAREAEAFYGVGLPVAGTGNARLAEVAARLSELIANR